MRTFLTILLSVALSLGGTYALLTKVPLSFFPDIQKQLFGATSITTIQGSDTISGSRTTINNNFSSLNTNKAEISDVSGTTTLKNLASVGTITTGVWNGTIVTAVYGGTGSSTLSSNQVILGNGTGVMKTVNGFGTSGQFLTSNGAATAPSWQSASVDQTQAYTWTGLHTFTGGWVVNNASSTIAGAVRFNGKNLTQNFGGDGSDGALSVSSGSTVIDLGKAPVVVKNYTSISITGTAYVYFTNAHAGGSVVILKSQGNATFTSSAAPMLDATSTGATGGVAAVGGCTDGNYHYGSGGTTANSFSFGAAIGGTSPSGTVTDGVAAPLPTTMVYGIGTSTSLTPYANIFVGSGGSSGGCGGGNPQSSAGGNGGNGGGALIIEVGGALNFTTANGISVNGHKGYDGSYTSGTNSYGGGGGGGGAGFFEMLYNSLTANSGTVTTAGGTVGADNGSGSRSLGIAGGGGNPKSAGSGVSTGGVGYSLIGQNPQ